MTHIEQQIWDWLDKAVIGLNLCPFAAKPRKLDQIKVFVSQADTEEVLITDIYDQLQELDQTDATELETTLVVVPNMLSDFFDYNFFIEWIENLITQQGWDGVYQVATFHPDYCFAGAHPDDDENLTNRAPLPVFHLIREASMEKVLKHYPDPESIPDNNIARIESLTPEQKAAIFPYLFS